MDRIKAMEFFVRVAERGSFSAVARELQTSQSTVSKQVFALEQAIGVELLARTTRSLTLTSAGERYFDRARRLVAEFAEAESVARSDERHLGGLLRVASTVSFGRLKLLPVIHAFQDEHPELQVELRVDDRHVDLVEEGIDVAVRMGRLADSTLGARYLGLNPWVAVAAPQYLRARGVPRHPRDLAAHEALVYSSVQGDARWHFSGAGHEAVVVPVRGRLRSNSLSTLLEAAAAGMGVAILPWYVASAEVRKGLLEALLPQWSLPAQEIHAVYPSPNMVPAKVTQFVDWLQGRFDAQWWTRAP